MAQRDREHERERERRERRKRGKRKYGQAKLKHAKRGVISSALSAGVFVLLTILLAVAYYSKGTAAPIIGGLGLIAVVLAGCGFYMGMRGFKEREKDYLTCKIGVVCSGLFILGFIMIFCRGLF